MRIPFRALAALSIVILAALTFAVAHATREALAANSGRRASGKGPLPEAPSSPGPDERFKADILVIVAHPDDETMVTGWLAQQIFDRHKRVAAIFGTRGDGGGNAMGYEQAAALGAEREIEARKALAYFGVMNVWFLDGPDTPGQDVLRSLETWNHGNALAKAIRLVRLTRPEVILTWLPDYVAGENHDDHQAAGVIATEAFDMAGDPTQFPEQVSAPRNRESISNLTEGLLPWQPKKLYYFSDAFHTDFLEGQGPKYETTGVSPSKQEPYYKLAAEEMAFHLTQGDTGQLAKQALATGQFEYFKQPVRFVFGKSLVGGMPTGDIFEGVTDAPIPFSSPHGYKPEAHSGLSIELGGPWLFYRQFWKAHSLDHLAALLPTPEVSIQPGETLHLPLVIRNDTGEPKDVALTSTSPEGWVERHGSARYPVRSHDVYPVQTELVAPKATGPEWQEVKWKAESNGETIGAITVKVHVVSGGLPQ
jgi:LmbE family N-acetylglucosaminyl deacetylase